MSKSSAFSFLKKNAQATQWWKIFGEIECLALMIACVCHDLDHRGTNNSFQIKWVSKVWCGTRYSVLEGWGRKAHSDIDYQSINSTKLMFDINCFCLCVEHHRHWPNCIQHRRWNIIISINVWWYWIARVIKFWAIYHRKNIVGSYGFLKMQYYQPISQSISGNFILQWNEKNNQ